MDCCDAPSWKLAERELLKAYDPQLDTFFGGGLPLSAFVECGFPMGREGRCVLFPFLANLSQGMQYPPAFVLWINGYENLQVFPPAWFARGLIPERTVFAQSKDVLVELKRIFMSPLFKMIVIDSPQFFALEDCLFLRRMAKKNAQMIVLLRNYFLTNKKGNIASGLRFNGWREHQQGPIVLQAVKGFGPRTKALWSQGVASCL